MPTAHRYFLHARSPLHAGTGQGTGVIDLPIAREKATGIPYLPGSSVKGTLRDSDVVTGDKELIFGPPTDRADEHAGAAQFADARLLLLPVRSLRGTFAWLTSPYILNRFAREIRDTGGTPPPAVAVAEGQVCQVASAQAAIVYQGQQVVIEDLDMQASASADIQEWATWIGTHAFPNDKLYQDMLMERLCVVNDNLFSFLLTTATEITARIQLDRATKTVKEGALWYEEALPVETLLAGVLLVDPPRKHASRAQEVLTGLQGASAKTLQFGGKATVGRGLCRVQIDGGK